MKLRKTMLFASTVALLFGPVSSTFAQSEMQEWTPRTIDQVKKDLIVTEDNKTIYTIQYGDTLSVIAEAIGVDVVVLGSINEIANLDLIYPESVLTTSYDSNHNAESMVIETPAATEGETPVVVEVDLVENQIVVEDLVLGLAETEVEVEATSAPTYVSEQVAEWVEQPVVTQAVTSEIESETVELAPTVEVTTEAVVAPAVEETTVAEWVAPVTTEVEATPVVEETESEVVLSEEETSAVSEWVAPAEKEVEVEPVVEEALAAEPVVEEVTEEIVEVYEEVVEESVVDEVVAPTYEPTAEPGLQPHVAAFKDSVAAQYGITSFSTYRPGDSGDHGQGLAVDFMVPVSSELGDSVAQYAIDQMGTHNISYVIWKQQIYGDWNQAWTMMEDRGSVTANHYDHVHVSFNP